MPMNPAVQAVIKAITRLQPDVANSWNSQRKVEDAAGKLDRRRPALPHRRNSPPQPMTDTRSLCACSPPSTSTSP